MKGIILRMTISKIYIKKKEAITIGKITELLKANNLIAINNKWSADMLAKFKDNIFATEFVNDDESELLYNTIMYWKEKADTYDEIVSKTLWGGEEDERK